ncbi:signal recognition particle-docking protein FtsY [Klebsiella pneumoniae subsp. pneumoniae]|nr:signal recognition particle-docking protein FtsY [Klebsiella pneumoniae subsp. pneumoniae]
METTRKIITNLTEGASRKQLRDAEALYGLLKEEMGEILAKVDEPLNVERQNAICYSDGRRERGGENHYHRQAGASV